MAFGTYFKKILGGVSKALPVIQKGAGIVNKFAPQISKFARNFGGTGQIVGDIIDTVGRGAGKVENFLSKNQGKFDELVLKSSEYVNDL